MWGIKKPHQPEGLLTQHQTIQYNIKWPVLLALLDTL